MIDFGRRGANPPQSTTLVDILDRVLDKGLVVAGDIRIGLANVELLTIRIRLLVCSIDKATEIGLDWWRRDEFLTAATNQENEVAALRARIDLLEQRLLDNAADTSPTMAPRRRRSRRQPEET